MLVATCPCQNKESLFVKFANTAEPTTVGNSIFESSRPILFRFRKYRLGQQDKTHLLSSLHNMHPVNFNTIHSIPKVGNHYI